MTHTGLPGAPFIPYCPTGPGTPYQHKREEKIKPINQNMTDDDFDPHFKNEAKGF